MTMAMAIPRLWLPLTLLCLFFGPAASFTSLPRVCNRRSKTTHLNVLDEGYGAWLGGHQPAAKEEHVMDPLHKELYKRNEELKRGIGKRFVVQTQRDFLNAHSTMSLGPFATSNIVTKLRDGDIITSKNIIGSWIQHEKGWSVAKYEGFVFLQPIDE
jgi:hypothetical protein